MKKYVYIMLIFLLCLVGCGKEKKKDMSRELNKSIKNITMDYEKDGSNCKVAIDFSSNERTVTTYGLETEKAVEPYNHVKELEQFIREKIFADERLYIKNSKKDSNNEDEQKVMWRIRVNFEDGEWAQVQSLSGNPYMPDYWDELITLIEDSNGSNSSMDVTYRNKYKIYYRSKNPGHPSYKSEYSTDCGWNHSNGSGDFIIDYYVKDGSVKEDYKDYDSLGNVKISDNTLKIVFSKDTNFTLLYEIDDDIYLQIDVSGSCELKQENIENQEEVIEYYIEKGYFDQVIDFDVEYLE